MQRDTIDAVIGLTVGFAGVVLIIAGAVCWYVITSAGAKVRPGWWK